MRQVESAGSWYAKEDAQVIFCLVLNVVSEKHGLLEVFSQYTEDSL